MFDSECSCLIQVSQKQSPEGVLQNRCSLTCSTKAIMKEFCFIQTDVKTYSYEHIFKYFQGLC